MFVDRCCHCELCGARCSSAELEQHAQLGCPPAPPRSVSNCPPGDPFVRLLTTPRGAAGRAISPAELVWGAGRSCSILAPTFDLKAAARQVNFAAEPKTPPEPYSLDHLERNIPKEDPLPGGKFGGLSWGAVQRGARAVRDAARAPRRSSTRLKRLELHLYRLILADKMGALITEAARLVLIGETVGAVIAHAGIPDRILDEIQTPQPVEARPDAQAEALPRGG